MDASQVLAVVGDQTLEREIDLTDKHAVGVMIEQAAKARDNIGYLGLVGGIEGQQAIDVRLSRGIGGIDWIVAKCRVLHQVPKHINAKTIDTTIEPKAHDGVHLAAHVRVAPIEIGLLLQKGVVVILACRAIKFPGRSPEIAEPIVRWSGARLPIAPNVPVPLLTSTRSATVDEPRMAIRCMVGDKVENDFDVASVRRIDQARKTVKAAKYGIDV